jgi:hypothetical protein
MSREKITGSIRKRLQEAVGEMPLKELVKETGIPQPTLSRILGAVKPRTRIREWELKKIAVATNVTVEWILGSTKKGGPDQSVSAGNEVPADTQNTQKLDLEEPGRTDLAFQPGGNRAKGLLGDARAQDPNTSLPKKRSDLSFEKVRDLMASASKVNPGYAAGHLAILARRGRGFSRHFISSTVWTDRNDCETLS